MADPIRHQLRSGIAWRLVDGEVVVFDSVSSRYLTVSGAGVALWHALGEAVTTDDLVAAVVEAYDVDEATARADAEAFIDSLHDIGVLADPAAS